MTPAFDDLAILDDEDGVGMHDGVQAMRDHDGGAVLAEMLDRFLHLFLGFRVERGGGFVQQHDWCISDQGAGDRDPLALASGQLRTMLADGRVVAERETHDEVVRAGGFGRGDDFGLGGGLPDRITIFRLPILEGCRTEAEVVAEVRTTVVHELAHHFGIDDDRLDDLGWA